MSQSTQLSNGPTLAPPQKQGSAPVARSAHEELEALTPRQKIQHWATARPWEGIRLDQKTVVNANAVLMDGSWNIIRMPLLVRKPCFGQPTAFARHGGIQPIRHPRFGVVPSKCMRCPAREACERVAKLRLRATPELSKAYTDFERAGGAYGLRNIKDCAAAAPRFDALIDQLIRHGGFTSSNDARVLQYYADDRARQSEAAAEKKRLARRKAVLEGHLDGEFEALLERHRIHRMVQLRLALVSSTLRSCLPRRARAIPLRTIETTADVWLAREVLRLRKTSVNPSAIAAELIRRWPHRYNNYNSLRARVVGDIMRVDALERATLDGRADPLWPRFSAREVMAAEELSTPYISEAT